MFAALKAAGSAASSTSQSRPITIANGLSSHVGSGAAGSGVNKVRLTGGGVTDNLPGGVTSDAAAVGHEEPWLVRTSVAVSTVITVSPWWLIATYYLLLVCLSVLICVGVLLGSQLHYLASGMTYIDSLKAKEQQGLHQEQQQSHQEGAEQLPAGGCSSSTACSGLTQRGSGTSGVSFNGGGFGWSNGFGGGHGGAGGAGGSGVEKAGLWRQLCAVMGGSNVLAWLVPKWGPAPGVILASDIGKKAT